MYRQGDIAIIPINRVPKGLIKVPRDQQGRIVLAEGEVTGHAHTILDDPATLFRREDMDEMADRFLRVEQEVAIKHEEHDMIVLPKGDYIVRHQREYQPEHNAWVAD